VVMSLRGWGSMSDNANWLPKGNIVFTTPLYREALSCLEARQFGKAIEVLLAEEESFKLSGHRIELGIAYTNLGTEYLDAENLIGAISNLKKAETVYASNPEWYHTLRRGINWTNLGTAYCMFGSEYLEVALEYYRLAGETIFAPGSKHFASYEHGLHMSKLGWLHYLRDSFGQAVNTCELADQYVFSKPTWELSEERADNWLIWTRALMKSENVDYRKIIAGCHNIESIYWQKNRTSLNRGLNLTFLGHAHRALGQWSLARGAYVDAEEKIFLPYHADKSPRINNLVNFLQISSDQQYRLRLFEAVAAYCATEASKASRAPDLMQMLQVLGHLRIALQQSELSQKNALAYILDYELFFLDQPAYVEFCEIFFSDLKSSWPRWKRPNGRTYASYRRLERVVITINSRIREYRHILNEQDDILRINHFRSIYNDPAEPEYLRRPVWAEELSRELEKTLDEGGLLRFAGRLRAVRSFIGLPKSSEREKFLADQNNQQQTIGILNRVATELNGYWADLQNSAKRGYAFTQIERYVAYHLLEASTLAAELAAFGIHMPAVNLPQRMIDEFSVIIVKDKDFIGEKDKLLKPLQNLARAQLQQYADLLNHFNSRRWDTLTLSCTLDALLGAGGTGMVFKAKAENAEGLIPAEEFALKVLDLSASPHTITAWKKAADRGYAQCIAGLSHPSLPQFFGAGRILSDSKHDPTFALRLFQLVDMLQRGTSKRDMWPLLQKLQGFSESLFDKPLAGPLLDLMNAIILLTEESRVSEEESLQFTTLAKQWLQIKERQELKVNFQQPVHLFENKSNAAPGATAAIFCMELVRGISFAEWRESKPAIDAFIEIFRRFAEISDAVGKLHRAGWIHQDIKPDNIVITETGPWKIVDMGSVRLINRPEEVPYPGTSWTNPPETFDHGTATLDALENVSGEKQVTTATDTWSLICTLFELLFEKKIHPFAAYRDRYDEQVSIVANDPQAKRKLLEAIAREMIEKDPTGWQRTIKWSKKGANQEDVFRELTQFSHGKSKFFKAWLAGWLNQDGGLDGWTLPEFAKKRLQSLGLGESRIQYLEDKIFKRGLCRNAADRFQDGTSLSQELGQFARWCAYDLNHQKST
jgi:serine/threonine protein kinase